MPVRPESFASTTLPSILLMLAGCSGLGDFDVERRIAEQHVRGSPLAGLLDDLFAVPIPMDVDIASETAARDTGPARSAHLERLELAITDTSKGPSDEDDFGFLDSVVVFIESTRSGSNLPRRQIAAVDAVSASDRLRFDVVRSVDVLPYADEGSRFTSEVEGRLPPDDVSFDGGFTLRIEVF